MSFAGHVFDMIRKDKEYREMRNLRKERIKGNRKTYLGKGKPTQKPNITIEQFEQIRQQTKEREQQEQHYIFKTTILITGIVTVVLLLLGFFSLF